MTIVPGAITLQPNRFTRTITRVARIVHADPAVTVICTRIALPLVSTSVVLQGDSARALASVAIWDRRRLLVSLTAAGFTVQITRTWFSTGFARYI